jgi:hypothetical protein
MAKIAELINAKELHPKREQRSLLWSEDAHEDFSKCFGNMEIIEVLILNQYWLKHMAISLVQDTECTELQICTFNPPFSSMQNTFFPG